MSRIVAAADSVTLPPGVEFKELHADEFTVEVPCWQTRWLPRHPDEPVEPQPTIMWAAAWSADLARAAEDRMVPIEEVARLVVAEVAVACARALLHEFVEHAAWDGVPLWDAHPEVKPGWPGEPACVSAHGAKLLALAVTDLAVPT